jgi:Fe-S cluster assembly iron-binding protein IscA
MIFDSHTIRDWEIRGITDVSCFLIERGCAWEKVSVVEGIEPDMDDKSMSQNSITFHTRDSEVSFFSDIRITHIGNKWIVAWDNINTHCGCGSSFARKTGNALEDKIVQMKEHIRQKKEKAH